MAKTLTEIGLAPSMQLFKLDHSAGLAVVEGEDGRLGLVRWQSANAYLDPPALLDAIVWGRADQLIPIAEGAEEALGFCSEPDMPRISTELRLLHRRVS